MTADLHTGTMPAAPRPETMARPRRDFHFVFGLKPQTEPLHLMFYLALESCRRVNAPDAIHFHYRNEPHGPYWERIRPYLTLHQVGVIDTGFSASRYQETAEGRLIQAHALGYAHEADVLRLQVLAEGGGCYADMDTLFVRPYPDALFKLDFAIAEEGAYRAHNGLLRPSLCNAVMFARPGASFVQRWLQAMPDKFNGTWSAHSCQAAADLAFANAAADAVLLPWAWFYRHGATAEGLATLFEQATPLRHDVFSMHLWAHLWWAQNRTDFSHFHGGLLTEDWVHAADGLYAREARAFIGG